MTVDPLADGFVFRNGERLETGVASVNVTSPFFVGGQSLFETMLVHKRVSKPVFRLEAHVKRLREASQRLGWQGVPDIRQLIHWTTGAIDVFCSESRVHIDTGRCRLTVAWTDFQGPPDIFVVIVPYVVPSDAMALYVTDVVLPWTDGKGAVKTGCRLTYFRAEALALSNGADEALLIDRDGRPAEGAKSNLFLMEDMGGKATVVTPPVDLGILPGIARDTVMTLAKDIGFDVREQPIGWRRFLNAAEEGRVFMTNSLWGIRPVDRLIDGSNTIECENGPEKNVIYLRQQVNETMYGNANS